MALRYRHRRRLRKANTCYTLYYFRLALLLGPLELPVLNTTKLVSFALGAWIQFSSYVFFFFVLLFFIIYFFAAAALRCQLPEGLLTLPMACPSANALLVTVTYTQCCADMSMCVLVGGPHMLLYWHSIWVIAIFSCSYAFFFFPIFFSLRVKMNFSTFHIEHCCRCCCCCSFGCCCFECN